MENCIVTQSRLLIKQWSCGFIAISSSTRSIIHEKLFWFHTSVLFSARPRPIILVVNYDAVDSIKSRCANSRHDSGPRGQFSKSRGLSASVSFLSSPPRPRSFTGAIFRAVFDSRSSFFAPKARGNACYAGYSPGGGEYSHTLPIRVCASQRGRDLEAPDLERGIHFRGV